MKAVLTVNGGQSSVVYTAPQYKVSLIYVEVIPTQQTNITIRLRPANSTNTVVYTTQNDIETTVTFKFILDPGDQVIVEPQNTVNVVVHGIELLP